MQWSDKNRKSLTSLAKTETKHERDIISQIAHFDQLSALQPNKNFCYDLVFFLFAFFHILFVSMANFSLVTKAIWIFIAPNWVRWCESVLGLSTNRRHVKVIIVMIWLRFAFRYGFYYGIWNMDHWNFVWLFWNNSFIWYSFSRDKFVQCKSHKHTHTEQNRFHLRLASLVQCSKSMCVVLTWKGTLNLKFNCLC